MSTPTPRILIVDNHESIAEAIAVRLRSEGYECATAYDGAQALAVFQSGAFDLVISDLAMPGGDGIALGESIRRISRVPMIFITGYQSEYFERMQALRDVSVLRKPFEEGSLLDLVETELALSRA